MTINGQVINVSNLIWTDGVKKTWVKRSVFVVQDFRHPNAAGVIANGQYKYFDLCCGSERIEYGLTDYPVYLAVITEDGRYRLEQLEPYIKERGGKLVFDVLDLPDQIHGLLVQKAEDFCNTPWDRRFNRPRGYVSFHTEKDSSGLWTIRGYHPA